MNDDVQRRSKLVTASAWVTAVITLMLAVMRFIVDGTDSAVGAVLVGGAIAFALAPLMVRVGYTAAAVVVPAVALVTLVVISALDGGLSSDATYWFPFIPVVGALFLGARGAVLFGGVTIAAQLVLAVFESVGMPNPQLLLRFMAASGSVLFGGALGFLYERGRMDAERRLEDERASTEALLSAVPDTIVRIGSAGEIREVRAPVLNDTWTPPASGTIHDWSKTRGNALAAQVVETIRLGLMTQRDYRLSTGDALADCEVRMAPRDNGQVVAVIRDVTQQKRLERLKGEFIATVSHEIRTPLTAMGGAMRLLEHAGLTEVQRAQALRVGSRNLDRLHELVTDLLDFQRLERRRITLRNEPTDVTEVLRRSVAEIDASANSAQFLILTTDPCVVVVDRQRLQRVLNELLSNALKFSPERGTIRVSVETVSNGQRIVVEDEGPGVPAELRDDLFSAFTRGDASDTRQRLGLGMGLALAHRISELMGAELGFDDEGRGSRFWITLPEDAPRYREVDDDPPPLGLQFATANAGLPRSERPTSDAQSSEVHSPPTPND